MLVVLFGAAIAQVTSQTVTDAFGVSGANAKSAFKGRETRSYDYKPSSVHQKCGGGRVGYAACGPDNFKARMGRTGGRLSSPHAPYTGSQYCAPGWERHVQCDAIGSR